MLPPAFRNPPGPQRTGKDSSRSLQAAASHRTGCSELPDNHAAPVQCHFRSLRTWRVAASHRAAFNHFRSQHTGDRPGGLRRAGGQTGRAAANRGTGRAGCGVTGGLQQNGVPGGQAGRVVACRGTDQTGRRAAGQILTTIILITEIQIPFHPVGLLTAEYFIFNQFPAAFYFTLQLPVFQNCTHIISFKIRKAQ